MNRFAQRSSLTELIDAPGIPFEHWHTCLQELNTINTWLGGHAITIEGVKGLLPRSTSTPITITEIGCGGGDNLKAIYKWNKKHDYRLQYMGIDLNKSCTDFAAENCRELPAIKLINDNYKTAQLPNDQADIIFNSLFCHHFTNDELVEMLIWLKMHSRIGFFINDLQRHPIAYYSIQWLTRLFSRSYLVKHDAPISVLRGFKKAEWEALLQRAGITNYKIKWRWAFRYLIIIKH